MSQYTALNKWETHFQISKGPLKHLALQCRGTQINITHWMPLQPLSELGCHVFPSLLLLAALPFSATYHTFLILQVFLLLLPLPAPNPNPALLEFLWAVGWKGVLLASEMVVTSLCIQNKTGKPDPVFVLKLKSQILTRSEETDAAAQRAAWARFRGKRGGNQQIQEPSLRVYMFVLPSDS